MPADYLSRLPSANTGKISEITECFDPFQPDLCDLQKADKSLQNMNHFWVHGQLPDNLPKSEANYLQNLAIKLYQDANNIVWISLDDYKYPQTALYLPEKYHKLALCEAHNHQFGGHNAALKTYIRILSSYYWPNCGQTFSITQKHASDASKGKNQQISHLFCNHCQLWTNPTSESTRTSSGPCSQPDDN